MDYDGVLTAVLAIVRTWTNGGRVLDLGGGSGREAVVLAGHGADVTVVDRSADALATLEQRAAPSTVTGRITPVQADIETLGDALEPATAFDLVLAPDVLDEAADPRVVLMELSRWVRAGAWLSVAVPNPIAGVVNRALSGRPDQALERLAALGLRPVLDLAGLCDALGAAGLRVERRLGHGVLAGRLGADAPQFRPDTGRLYLELDQAVAEDPAFWSLAARLQVLARRPAGSGPSEVARDGA